MAELDSFLAAAESRVFSWGEFDCVLFGADWVKALTGKDPAAQWRGRYSTPLGARRIIARSGGFVPMIDHALTGVGLIKTKSPARGDVGVLRSITVDGMDLVAAVYTGARWSCISSRGLLTGRGDPVECWRYG